MNLIKVRELIGLDTNTAKCYRYSVQRYQKITGLPLTLDTLCQHLNEMKDKYAAATIELDAGLLFRALIGKETSLEKIAELEKLRKELLRSIRVKDSTSYTQKSISKAEIQKIITAAPERLSIIIQALAETGLRVSELCSIKLSDENKFLGNDKYKYFEVIGKGQKKRSVFFSKNLMNRIQKVSGKVFLFETIHGKMFNRTYISRKISEVSMKILNKPVHSHTLRHSFISLELAAGTAIDALSRYVGHSDTAFTVKRYCHNLLNPEMLGVRYCA